MVQPDMTVFNKQVRERSAFEVMHDIVRHDPECIIQGPSLVRTPSFSVQPLTTYTIETTRNQDGWNIFLEIGNEDGHVRVALPNKACEAIYRHREAVIKKSMKRRGKDAAEARKRKEAQKKLDEECAQDGEVPLE